jgi:hypothetical protein
MSLQMRLLSDTGKKVASYRRSLAIAKRRHLWPIVDERRCDCVPNDVSIPFCTCTIKRGSLEPTRILRLRRDRDAYDHYFPLLKIRRNPQFVHR